MRVLMLTPMPPDADAPGAIPALLSAQLQGLSRRHDVTVISVAGPDPAELAAVDRLAVAGVDIHAARRGPAAPEPRWARRRRLAGAWLRGRWPWRTVWFWEPTVQAVIDRLAAQRRFDIVAAEDNAMGIYRLPASAAHVITEAEVRRARGLRPPPPAPARWPGWAFAEADWRRWPRYETDVWRRFDAVQVYTERDADAVVALAPDVRGRLHVNPFGVVVPPARDEPEERETIGFLGNYTHPPNVDAAVWLAREILPRLHELRPGARLRLAGPYAPAAVRELTGPGVEVLGQVPDADRFIRHCAVVLAPVRIGGGMRMKVLHAMALGRPVVTTRRGIEGLALNGRTPPLAVADDAAGIAAVTAELLADRAARRALGARARAFVVEHHGPDAVARRLEAVYDRALATRGKRP